MAYDMQNIFAKIIAGQLPCHKIHSDESCFALLDIHPRARGHTLVLPRAPSVNLLDIAQPDLQAVILCAQKIARAAMRAFSADGITLQQFSEAAGGQVVFHTHFHVVPRYDGQEMRPPMSGPADDAALAEDAKLLREALATLPN